MTGSANPSPRPTRSAFAGLHQLGYSAPSSPAFPAGVPMHWRSRWSRKKRWYQKSPKQTCWSLVFPMRPIRPCYFQMVRSHWCRFCRGPHCCSRPSTGSLRCRSKLNPSRFLARLRRCKRSGMRCRMLLRDTRSSSAFPPLCMPALVADDRQCRRSVNVPPSDRTGSLSRWRGVRARILEPRSRARGHTRSATGSASFSGCRCTSRLTRSLRQKAAGRGSRGARRQLSSAFPAAVHERLAMFIRA